MFEIFNLKPALIKTSGYKIKTTMKVQSSNSLRLSLITSCIILIASPFALNTLMAQNFEMVKDINPDGHSSPTNFTLVNNILYFIADDGVHGSELWVSNGTDAGTQLLKDIKPGIESSSYWDLIEYNGKLYFSANDGTHGQEPWFSDGTTDGTQILTDISPGLSSSDASSFTISDSKLYFVAWDPDHGYELWMSDGTSDGTQLLKDINPGSNDGFDFSTVELTEYNGKLYFSADNGNHGKELWVSDGTSEGTQMLKDINPGVEGSMVQSLTAIGGKLYFSADNGTHGKELWVSDGTADGTQLLKDINPGSDEGNPYFFYEYDGKIYFVANDGITGAEPWVTDGTTSGTKLLKDIKPGIEGSNPGYHYAVYNGKLFFQAKAEYDPRIWVTDGTTEGTQLLMEDNSSSPLAPDNFTEYNGKLYFAAHHEDLGKHLWVTDGTPEGTSFITPDIATNHGPLDWQRGLLVALGSLYFSASYNSFDTELWKLTTVETVGIEDYAKDEFKVYPNPVQNVLYFETGTNAIQRVEIFSITGQQLKTWVGQSDINMSQFASGSYFVKITTNDGNIMVKQVIKD